MAKRKAHSNVAAVSRFEAKYREFIASVSLKPFDRESGTRLFGRSYGHNNAFLGWSSDTPLLEATREAQRIVPRVSEEAIRKTIERSLVELFEQTFVREDAEPGAQVVMESLLAELSPEAVRRKAEEVLEMLRSQTHYYTVFIPIEGIKFQIPSLKIGDVEVLPVDSPPLSRLLNNESAFPEGVISRIRESYAKASCYCLVDDIEGDPKYAIQVAIDKAKRVLDVLSFLFGSCRDRWQRRQKISVSGEAALNRGRDIVCIFKSVGKSQSIEKASRLFNQSEGLQLHAHTISVEAIRQLEDLGWADITGRFSTPLGRGDGVTARIQRAVQWFSKGVNSDNVEEQYVCLAIALESLLIGGGEGRNPNAPMGSITQRLRERVAFLIGGNLAERIALDAQIRELYDYRSKIVHNGDTVSRENLIKLEDIVYRSIWAVAKLEQTSWDEFIEWEKQQKYSVSVNTEGTG